MTEDEVKKSLKAAKALFSRMLPTYEPTNEQEVLEERMDRYGFFRNTITTDENCRGDCVVRAISSQFHGNEDRHEDVRRAGVARLIQFRSLYEEHLSEGETYEQYVKRVSRVDEDVDVLFKYAISDAYGVRIIELVSNENYCISEYIPENKKVTRTIHIVSSMQHTDSMCSVFED